MEVSKHNTVTRSYFPRNHEYLLFLLYELLFSNKYNMIPFQLKQETVTLI